MWPLLPSWCGSCGRCGPGQTQVAMILLGTIVDANFDAVGYVALLN